jgi:hypothetical protein
MKLHLPDPLTLALSPRRGECIRRGGLGQSGGAYSPLEMALPLHEPPGRSRRKEAHFSSGSQRLLTSSPTVQGDKAWILGLGRSHPGNLPREGEGGFEVLECV